MKAVVHSPTTPIPELVFTMMSMLPRSSVAALQARMASLLQFDVLGVRSGSYGLCDDKISQSCRCSQMKSRSMFSLSFLQKLSLYARSSAEGGDLYRTTSSYGRLCAQGTAGDGAAPLIYLRSNLVQTIPSTKATTMKAWVTKKKTQCRACSLTTPVMSPPWTSIRSLPRQAARAPPSKRRIPHRPHHACTLFHL